jgi:hypothetical protein
VSGRTCTVRNPTATLNSASSTPSGLKGISPSFHRNTHWTPAPAPSPRGDCSASSCTARRHAVGAVPSGGLRYRATWGSRSSWGNAASSHTISGRVPARPRGRVQRRDTCVRGFRFVDQGVDEPGAWAAPQGYCGAPSATCSCSCSLPCSPWTPVAPAWSLQTVALVGALFLGLGEGHVGNTVRGGPPALDHGDPARLRAVACGATEVTVRRGALQHAACLAGELRPAAVRAKQPLSTPWAR